MSTQTNGVANRIESVKPIVSGKAHGCALVDPDEFFAETGKVAKTKSEKFVALVKGTPITLTVKGFPDTIATEDIAKAAAAVDCTFKRPGRGINADGLASEGQTATVEAGANAVARVFALAGRSVPVSDEK